MKNLIYLPLLISGLLFADDYEDEDYFLQGRSLYDQCLQVIKGYEDGVESLTKLEKQKDILCRSTIRTFILTNVSLMTDLAGSVKENDLIVQLLDCTLTFPNQVEIAYQLTAFIRNNPDYRTEPYTTALLDFYKEKCSIKS
tara:strand:- start:35 stop:457 length:423 start_codon:yes stop_codon:yes gene_type:complete